MTIPSINQSKFTPGDAYFSDVQEKFQVKQCYFVSAANE